MLRPGPLLLTLAAVLVAGLAACVTPSETFVVSKLGTCEGGPSAPATVRVASYNIRSALSSSIDRIGEVIDGLDADVVALEEVDVGVKRTGRVDQAKALADRLGYDYAFAATMKRQGGLYGIALLSRLPIVRANRIDLRTPGAWEPRVAIDADVCVAGEPVRFVAVHADNLPWSAASNGRELARRLGGTLGPGFILAGDLNEAPTQAGPRALEGLGLTDLIGRDDEGPTFPGKRDRIDYIFVGPSLEPMVEDAGRVEVPGSDHIPIVADLRVDPVALSLAEPKGVSNVEGETGTPGTSPAG